MHISTLHAYLNMKMSKKNLFKKIFFLYKDSYVSVCSETFLTNAFCIECKMLYNNSMRHSNLTNLKDS